MREVRKQTGVKLCLEFLHWLKGPSPEGLTPVSSPPPYLHR